MTTITNVQAPKYGTAAGNSVTVPWDSTPTAGNLLIARAIGAAAADGGDIPDWVRVDYARYGATTGRVSIFVKKAGASEGDVTVTFTGASTTRLFIEEWHSSTGWPDVPTDKSTHLDNTGSTVTSKSTGTTGTTIVADELSVSVIGWGSAVTGISWSNSFSASFEQPTGALTFAGAHKILSSTGTQETTASWTTARLAGAAIATFRPNYELTTQAGVITPSADVSKGTSKSIGGEQTPSGVISRIVSKITSGAVAPEGIVSRSIGRSASGDIAGVGGINKATVSSFQGSITPAGVLATIKTSVKDFGGDLSPAGSTNKGVGKSQSGDVTSAGTISRTAAKNNAGQVQSSGVLSFLANKIFSGDLSSSGELSSVLIPGGGTTYSRSVDGVVTTLGYLETLFIPGVPVTAGSSYDSWGSSFVGDIDRRQRDRFVPEERDDDEEALLALLLWKAKNA